MANRFCGRCGFALQETDTERDDPICPQCGRLSEEKVDSFSEQDPAGHDPSRIQNRSAEHCTLEFTGTPREYFRIWIVNTFLTIVTIGIYAAWAKVRTRQYFYAHTRLAGQPFHFLGQPMAILKGNLIIGTGLIIYLVLKGFDPVYASAVLTVFYLILPYLLYKSLRFNTRYSAFRNIRFRFLGTIGESYLTYLFFPVLIPFTLGIIMPYWEFRRKRYLFNNLAFGATRAVFKGMPGFFYRTFITIGLVPAAVLFLLAIGAAILIPFIARLSPASQAVPQWTIMFLPIAFSVIPLLILTIIQQFLYVRLMNYCWNETRLEGIRFRSTLEVRPLIWIRLTSILAVLFSAGLLIPWAKIRRFRYIVEHLTIISEDGLDSFAAAEESDVGALGDTATDFFDIGFGL
ncbi:MAG: hypothetical protein C0392_03805 [Syntrophus sp. (in: bacteria)]|nr:hypothetical protein [Syntrophus sp. (in: bacteria)]